MGVYVSQSVRQSKESFKTDEEVLVQSAEFAAHYTSIPPIPPALLCQGNLFDVHMRRHFRLTKIFPAN